jgi:perosamine synthetase
MIAQPHTSPTLRFGDLRTNGTCSLGTLFERTAVLFTYNGRGALYQLCGGVVRTDRKIILLPAFNCPSVVDPVIAAGFRPRYYAINTDLSIDVEDFLSKLDSNVAAAIAINYFGFPADLSKLAVPCREAGALLIEDCAHSFLYADPIRLSGERGDVAVFSFKKLIPSHVGGGIRFNRQSADIGTPQAKAPLRDTVVNCKQLLEEALDNLGDSRIRWMYHRLESIRLRLKSGRRTAPDTPTNSAPISTFEYPFDLSLASARLPWYARRVINAANIQFVSAERRANYSALIEGLHTIEHFVPVYKTLPSTVCPWAFPILADDRSLIDRRLQTLGVPIFSFGETMHSSIKRYAVGEKDLLDKARYLSTALLLIAVRQGLPTDEFRKYCDIVHSLFGI